MNCSKRKKTSLHTKAKKVAAVAVAAGIALTGSAWVFADSCFGSIEEPILIEPVIPKNNSAKSTQTVTFLEPQTIQVQTSTEAAKTAELVAPPAEPEAASTSDQQKNPNSQPAQQTITQQATETTMYTTQSCYIRSKDVAGSNVLKSLKSGTAVILTGTANNGYYSVKSGGYLHKKFLSETKPTSKPSKPAKPAEPTDSNTQNSSNSSSGGNSAQDGKHDGSVRGILNSAALNPTGTGFANVDAKINSIFNQIFTSDMDTYDKVKACYDYLIKNTSYRRNGGYSTAGYGNISNQSGKNYIAWAAMSTLDTGYGACNGYSAAFIAMVRMIGLNAGYASGETYSNSKGWMGHHWAEIYIGGETYIFDPQVEDNIAGGGKISYTRFCKTYAERAKQYRK